MDIRQFFKTEEKKEEVEIVVPYVKGAFKNYEKSYIADKKLGDKIEKETQILIDKFFNCKFETTKDFERYDFISQEERIIAELKGRRNTKDKYKTTIIGMNKINHYNNFMLPNNWRVILLFSFTDGLYYYDFKSIENRWIKDGGRYDRANSEWKIKGYYHIPVKYLKKIN